ncbi:MAG: hypothetical protein Q8Q88_14905 [Phenylobacterium sp.]|uniref:hypothetical protein n=1 Tax=Phenylobacterium sp. TaxID=1871053 RepID=UPI0027330A7B|nr:hypothetical protein [Phenylobacterium sp.]MDP3748326.1 hypothetical protein [Phenylobacterium sp.]
MADAKRWVVTAAPERSLPEIAKTLSDQGFSIDQQLDDIGVLMGSADEALAERIRGLPGVADVSPDEDVDIGPPDSPETW